MCKGVDGAKHKVTVTIGIKAAGAICSRDYNKNHQVEALLDHSRISNVAY